MSSIFVRILLSAALLFVLSSVAVVWTSIYLFRREPDVNNFIRQVLDAQLEDTRQAWETGGGTALAAELKRLDDRFPGQHALLEASGTDVLTGKAVDTSGIVFGRLPLGFPFFRPPRRGNIAHRSGDGKYVLYALSEEPPVESPNYAPYYFPIVLVFVLGIYLLAHYLGRPLRQLRETVMRFGAGELEARTGSTRRDEFGDVARSFDDMAERIQTLLTAERRLLQDISHELRSPLARLSVAVELARTSADRNGGLDRIKKESQRTSMLVGELIEMTRAEGDPTERAVAAVDLRELVEDLLDELLIEADTKGVRLEREMAGPMVVQGDAELLRRAVENVVRNSIRQSPVDGDVRVRMSREGDRAVIVVRDFGPGVPEEMLEAIFRPFFRVEHDRARVSGGVGLGLAIARRALHLHHGEMVARNAEPGLEVTIGVALRA